MTTEGHYGGGDDPDLETLPTRGRVLVRSTSPPVLPGPGCVDVRPGGVATFDGERVRLSLWVAEGTTRVPVDWSDLGGLEITVTSLLRRGGSRTVRFGGRAACRTAMGAAGVDAVERRLAEAAGDGRATLVTWTTAPPSDHDYRTYDIVHDGTGTGRG